MQIRCYFPGISYLSEMQKNNFHFLINISLMSDNMCIFVTANMSQYESKLIYQLTFLNHDFYDIVFW